MANTEKFIIAFDKAFKAAVEREENFNDEGINWDFVDADVTMDLKMSGIEYDQAMYNEEFDFAAQEWIEYNETVFSA